MTSRRATTAREPDFIRGERCSVLRSLDMFGDYWSLGVIRCAAFGYRRFGEFHEQLGVATNILSERLARLVDAGILERVKYEERPPRFEYRLSSRGAELVPLILVLKGWGDRHLQPGGPRTVQRHRGCTSQVHVRPVCPDCGAELAPGEIETAVLPHG
jgi:DNA-binding HxlR family transcriptional regulator